LKTRNQRYRLQLNSGIDGDTALSYNFAEDKSLVARLGPTLGIARATTATYFDSGGTLRTAGSGVARFDHNPRTGESLGLLVEGARTNLCLQSATLGTTWTPEQCVVDNNVAVSPDGSMTMDRLNIGSGAGIHDIYIDTTTNAATDYAVSVFLKNDGAGFGGVCFGDGGNNFISVTANLTTGVITDEEEGATSGTIASSGVDDIGNGVFRVWVVGKVTPTGTFVIPFVAESAVPTYSSGRATFTAVGGKDMLVWGAQLEPGSTISSYIPTTTLAVARNADALALSDVTWLSATGGTVYFDTSVPDVGDGSTDHYLAEFSDGTADNRIVINRDAGNAWQYYVESADVAVANITAASQFSAGDTPKIAVAWSAGDFTSYIDGAVVGTPDAAGALPTITEVAFGGSRLGSLLWYGHIKELRYYNVRKPNEFLVNITL